jgi:hypothetical protein
MRLSPGCSLGNEDHGEGGLACREGIRREAGSFKTRATRFSGGRALGSVTIREAGWNKSNFCSVMFLCRRRKNTWAASSDSGMPSMIGSGLNRA